MILWCVGGRRWRQQRMKCSGSHSWWEEKTAWRRIFSLPSPTQRSWQWHCFSLHISRGRSWRRHNPVAHALAQLPRHPEPRRGSRPCVTVSNTHLTINSGGANVSRPLGATASRTDGQRSLSLTLTVTTPQSSQHHHDRLCSTAFTPLFPSLSSSFPNLNLKKKKGEISAISPVGAGSSPLLPSSASSETLNTSVSHRDAWRGRRRIGPLPWMCFHSYKKTKVGKKTK